MTNDDKEAFATLFYGVGEYYNKPVSKELLLTYFNALGEYLIDDVKKSVNKHLMDSEHGNFFPKLSDIVRNSEFKPLGTEDKAELAWAQIRNFMRSSGSYGTLKLDDGQAMAALKSFTSWKDLCLMPESSMTWAKKEFVGMYATYENTPLEMLPSSLPGLIDLQNHKKEQNVSFERIKEGIKQHRLKKD